ncbi:hypothetical protein PHMEG_00019080 [Phytophthora megakarya]|uniref:Uncharacterized protein n=1 Tax=Phytophthora megakarya TaxID=4795 RepID=A0A225VV14_9STRA|nr:hypothetical protein PHMEG_00019080 [Phytophthora megakarya]
MVHLLAVDSMETHKAIDSATTTWERTTTSLPREVPLQAPATPSTAVIGGHYFEENPDMRDNTQCLKHR